MSTICEFGTAPEQALEDYRMTGVVVGSDNSVLADHEGRDVRLVRGAMIWGSSDKYEFAVMVKQS